MVSTTNYYYQLIHTLAVILDRDGNHKLNHGLRTAVIAANLVELIDQDMMNTLFYTGLLHDVGGVGLPSHMVHYVMKDDLDVPGVKEHSLVGSQIMRQLPGLEESARIIHEHHERWDGKGFPDGLSGGEISILAQVLLIADHLDVKIREYHGDRTLIYNYFRQERGKMYDPDLWPVLLDLIGTRNNGFYYRIIDDRYLYDMANELEEKLPLLKIDLLAEDYILKAVRVFGQVIDTKHPYTQGHSQRVASYSVVLAEHLGLNEEQLRDIRLAGHLHDLGKLTVPLSILDKETTLTEEEFARIKNHVLITRELLDYEPTLRHLAPIAGSHHEKWDGTGYPDGLKGEEIPLGGRIMALADALDAVSSARPYHQPLALAAAARKLLNDGGSHFDPQITALLEDNQVLGRLHSAREEVNDEIRRNLAHNIS